MTAERARITPDGGSTQPLAPDLRDDLPEARVQRMWRRIDRAPARRNGAGLAWAAALAMVLVFVALGAAWWLAPTTSSRPLALSSGAVPLVLAAEQRAEAPRFDDGSQITLQEGGRVEVLRNDARSFVTSLRRGDATFDVKPGGKRHWVIEAGELSVEVVGTRFRVQREPEATRVSVEHGVVLVRGERVNGGSVRLTAGQSFSLEAPRALASTAPKSELVVAPPAPPAARPSAALVDPVAKSLAEADTARRRGDSASAAQHFEAAWSGAAVGDSRRGLAALSLARLLGAGNPAKTARILRSSLPDMPSALREDAQARLVEAEARAGNPSGARQAAEEYRRLFPEGQRRPEVERWSAP